MLNIWYAVVFGGIALFLAVMLAFQLRKKPEDRPINDLFGEHYEP